MSKPICIIVLGTPRSGTTLISTAIGAHEKICLLDEDFHFSVVRISGGKPAPSNYVSQTIFRWNGNGNGGGASSG